MEVDPELIYNLIIDMKKKDIHPIDRGILIKQYIQTLNISARQFSKETGIPHSTIQDWLDYSKINKTEYNTLTNNNHSKKEIHKLLRNTRTKNLKLNNPTNIIIQECIIKLKPLIHNIQPNQDTNQLIHELTDTINRIQLKIKR